MKQFLGIIAALFRSFGKKTAPIAPPAAPPAAPPDGLMLSAHDLAIATGARIDRAQEHLPHIIATMAEFDIDTPTRQAAFLAQIGHESGGLHWLIEIWGPTPAQSRYEGRADLGNTRPGDGYKYRGRGLIQLTGRFNYAKASVALGINVSDNPELLGQSPLADRVAGWFWQSHGCNEIADGGDFKALTKRINGGTNGLSDRLALWGKAKSVLA